MHQMQHHSLQVSKEAKEGLQVLEAKQQEQAKQEHTKQLQAKDMKAKQDQAKEVVQITQTSLSQSTTI